MIVVDTNVISYLYIAGERSEQVERLLLTDSDWHVPTLWRSEFRNVLAMYLRRDILSLDEVLAIIEEAENFLKNGEYEVNSMNVMNLVNNSQCSAYDCEFVALAKHLHCPLVTADKKILKEFPEVAQSLEVVSKILNDGETRQKGATKRSV